MLESDHWKIIDMKPPGKRRRLRKGWTDAVDRDREMMRLERKMADDRRRWQGTIDSQVQCSLDCGRGFSDVDWQIVLLSSDFNE